MKKLLTTLAILAGTTLTTVLPAEATQQTQLYYPCDPVEIPAYRLHHANYSGWMYTKANVNVRTGPNSFVIDTVNYARVYVYSTHYNPGDGYFWAWLRVYDGYGGAYNGYVRADLLQY